MVKTSHFQQRGCGSITGQRIRSLHAMWQGQKNEKEKRQISDWNWVKEYEKKICLKRLKNDQQTSEKLLRITSFRGKLKQ